MQDGDFVQDSGFVQDGDFVQTSGFVNVVRDVAPRRPARFRRTLGAVSFGCLLALALAGCGRGAPPGAGGAPTGAGGAPPGAGGGTAAGAHRSQEPAPAPAPTAPAELPQRSAEAFRGAEARSAAEYLGQPRYAGADFRRGELLAYACKACHALTPAEDNDLGPNLSGVIGRSAASFDGFEYSDALRASGIVWTPEAIETWLAAPEAFVPGTKMKFTGFQSVSDRRDVVAYLLRHTSGADQGADQGADKGADKEAPPEARTER
jgi:cytochrome c